MGASKKQTNKTFRHKGTIFDRKSSTYVDMPL